MKSLILRLITISTVIFFSTVGYATEEAELAAAVTVSTCYKGQCSSAWILNDINIPLEETEFFLNCSMRLNGQNGQPVIVKRQCWVGNWKETETVEGVDFSGKIRVAKALFLYKGDPQPHIFYSFEGSIGTLSLSSNPDHPKFSTTLISLDELNTSSLSGQMIRKGEKELTPVLHFGPAFNFELRRGRSRVRNRGVLDVR